VKKIRFAKKFENKENIYINIIMIETFKIKSEMNKFDKRLYSELKIYFEIQVSKKC